MWSILVIVHMLCLVAYTILLRKASTRSTHPLFTGALMTTGFLVPTPVYIALGLVRVDLSLFEWLWIGIGGFMLAGLMAISSWSLSKTEASLYTIIFNLRLLFITILAFIFLHELPNTLQMMGGVVIFISIVLLNLHKEQRWKSAAVLSALLATLWFSVHATIEKFNVSHITPIETYFTWFSIIGTLISWLLVWVRGLDMAGQWHSLHHKNIAWLLITRIGSGLSYAYALKFGTVAATNYVSGMGVAVIVLVGIYVLGEKQHKAEKLYAVGLSCVGLTLILLAH